MIDGVNGIFHAVGHAKELKNVFNLGHNEMELAAIIVASALAWAFKGGWAGLRRHDFVILRLVVTCCAIRRSPADNARNAISKWPIYGQVVSSLGQAPRSTDDDGRYGSVKPAPIAELPGESAKLVPTGSVVSVPTELLPTSTQSGAFSWRLGGTR